MPKTASGTLSEQRASTAAERLASSNKPTGKVGSPVLTIKLRKEFALVREDRDVDWASWLDEQGYAIGDNENVYKK